MKALNVKTERDAVEAGLKLVIAKAARQDIIEKRSNIKFWPGYWENMYGSDSSN